MCPFKPMLPGRVYRFKVVQDSCRANWRLALPVDADLGRVT